MKVFTNWRNYVLLLLAMLAMVLLLGEPTATDGAAWFTTFAVTKVAAVALGYAYWRLFTYWDKRGQLPEINAMFTDL